MPMLPNRKTKVCNLKMIRKQKKQVASRLLQISLKVDDYVYKNKPISVHNAAMFIKEVAGYKDKCYEDRRSLQVIEKLTRCMQGIIAEQQELQAGVAEPDVTVVDVEPIFASSMDDDLTQLTQEINANKHLENDIELIERSDEKCINENGLIQLCNVDLDKTKEVQMNNIDMENILYKNEQLQRAISNLTLRGEADPLTLTIYPEDCSQSILNNMDCFSNIDIDKNGFNNKVVNVNEDFERFIQPTTIKTVAITSASIALDVGEKRDSLKRLNSTFIPITTNIENTSDTKKNITKMPRQKRNTNQKCNENNEKQNRRTSGKRNNKKKEVAKEHDIATTAPERIPKTAMKLNKGEVAKKLNKNIQKKSNETYKETCTTSNSGAKQVRSVKPAFTAMYDKDTENDLSWIENIRYVREITEEESIPVYFEDSFWENYTLPQDWNDNDFLY